MHGPNSPLDWLMVVLTIVVLLFAWLVYIGRGKRQTKVTFSGFGVSMTIDSAERDTTTVVPSPPTTSKE